MNIHSMKGLRWAGLGWALGAYLEHFEIETTHFENRCLQRLGLYN
jgi:hypothetical protein